MVEWLFLAVPWGGLRFVIVVFPDHTHLLYFCLTTGMHKNLFFMGVALLSISPASHGQLVKMLTTLELHGIFGPNCIRVIKHCPAIGMHNCDEAAGKI